MKFVVVFLFFISPIISIAQSRQAAVDTAALRTTANRLAQAFLIVDTHIDVPYRLLKKMEDISVRTADGEFDYVRAKAGGLDVPFMSVYVPAEYQKVGGNIKPFTEKMIDMVQKFALDYPDKFALVNSVSDVDKAKSSGKILLTMGMENGAPLLKLDDVAYYHKRGIRYVTLTHSRDNHICDSSYDTTHTWNGLSDYGKQVIAEMNRVGIMVDISHVSDSAFYQTLRLTKAPVIASHSSCRTFTPGFERNMSDDMIRLLAKNGGVIQINFGNGFLSAAYRAKLDELRRDIEVYLKNNKLTPTDSAARAYIKSVRSKTQMPAVTVMDVANHIDHVKKLVGVNHIGIGSDYDGVSGELPLGLNDVSMYPNLIYELLKRGYTDDDIRKICGGNLMRVWSSVETVARELQTKQP
ncbi:MAG: peptidase M19 [[Candidatus Thermochlorobacteriaceae] bacterium GBChlB]|nr:MAG: peptidase M19 [[Candidatus Thermochlorobacteriaceae] bacterium GBChlB]